jgi:hypothetical protein
VEYIDFRSSNGIASTHALEAGGGREGIDQKHLRNFTWKGQYRTIQFCVKMC